MISHKKRIVGIAVIIGVFVTLLFAMPQEVSAGGAVGGGGGSGGCSSCGGPSTNNGYGWYRYSTSSSGPRDFKDGNTWNNVRNQCVATGNDEVIAFIIERSDENVHNARVYKYESWDYGTYYDYKGDDGGSWLTYPSAKSLYDSIDASLKVGYAWGSNVAWFCYSNNPLWSVSVSTSVNKTTAKPGDTVTWTHTVRNNGPAKTNKTVTYSKKVGWIIDDNHTLPNGSGSGTTLSFTSSMNITQDNVDQTFCRATTAIPSTHVSSNRITSADACVSVPYDWSAYVDTDVTRVVMSDGKVSGNLAIAEPGGIVTWTHVASITGATKTNYEVDYSQVNGSGLPPGLLQFGTFPLASLPGVSDSQTSTLAITQDEVDTSVCRLTRADPRNQVGTNSIDSAEVCVFVPYNYQLTPSISTASSDAVEGGSEVTVDVSIDNSGVTKSKLTEWVITEMEVVAGSGAAGVPNPDGGNSDIDPCGTYFLNGTTTCGVIASGSSVFATDGSVLSGDILNSQTRDIDDLPIGTRLCFALSVRDRASDDSQWAHSAPVCVVIGKKPKVQVLGGDLAVGRGQSESSDIVTATTIKTLDGVQRTFGSWSEYGVLSNGIITGMGSGSAYVNGSISSDFCTASLLSFTNADSAVCAAASPKGNYVSLGNLPDIGTAFTIDDSTPSFSGLSDSVNRHVVTASSTITLTGGTIEAGDWLVINAPNETVNITGDITYTTDELSGIDDIPQLVIIANRINIAGSVNQIDAWLIASGKDGIITTCSDVTVDAPLTVDDCSDQLTVNGPVIAKSLYLRRTFGADPGPGSSNPAEIFNLRPDAYLWSIARASESSRAQSVYTTELPPRF